MKGGYLGQRLINYVERVIFERYFEALRMLREIMGHVIFIELRSLPEAVSE